MKICGIFMLLTIGAASVAAADKAPWRGFLWPVKSERAYILSLGVFPSLEACRRSAVIRVLAAGWRDGADWECGFNCRPRDFPRNTWKCDDRTR